MLRFYVADVTPRLQYELTSRSGLAKYTVGLAQDTRHLLMASILMVESKRLVKQACPRYQNTTNLYCIWNGLLT